MKVGLYSISCSGTWFNDRPALTVEEFIDTAKKYGFDGIEIDLKRPHGSPLDLTPRRIKEIRDYAEKNGLEMAGMSANNNFASPVPEHIENELLMVKEQIRITKELGASVLRLFVAWRGITFVNGIATYETTAKHTTYYGSLDYEIRQRATKAFKEAAKWAEDAGVVLALQNHHPIIQTYHDMLDFIKWVDSPNFKACFDVPCLGWTAGMQDDAYVAQAVRDVGDLQMLSHANAEFVENADGSVSMVSFDRNIQPVLTNYPVFIKTLKEIGYKGYINYEFCHMPFREGKVLGYNDYIDNQIRLAQIYFRDLVNNA
ncbi:MAG: sugar phosphate isomerase/epimerase [Anaerolineae bacterium]|jgi:sugar phosphate isomerase/epimerase|nr:sugar phosphate isomerase/epimerase [Anaerolineae bacterium]